MNDTKTDTLKKPEREQSVTVTPPLKKLPWETPKIEDVSEQVMAQPYIRFT